MPDPITHATASAFSYSGLASLIALFFEVPPNVVGWALIGSVIAVMMLQKFTFKVGAFITMSGTFAGAVTSPFVFKWTESTLIGIPFLISFSIIFFWGIVSKSLEKAIAARIEKLGGGQ